MVPPEQVHPGTAVGRPPLLGHGQVAPILFDNRLPLSTEIGTYKTVKARFWPLRLFVPWLGSGKPCCLTSRFIRVPQSAILPF